MSVQRHKQARTGQPNPTRRRNLAPPGLAFKKSRERLQNARSFGTITEMLLWRIVDQQAEMIKQLRTLVDRSEIV
jgi:hypothetical protein